MIPTYHPLGWIPDRPDHRDRPRLSPPSSVTIPDMRLLCSAVVDDGAVGMCSASAVLGAVELLLRRHGDNVCLSRSFLYFHTRRLMGVHPELDTGATIRDALRTMHNVGTCQEGTWTSGPAHLGEVPSGAAEAEASAYRIQAYERLEGLGGVLDALALGTPVVGGFSLPASVLTDEVSGSGTILFPGEGQGFYGGHAVLFVGYDSGFLVFKNSWGAAWGEVGYGRLDVRFVERGLARDFWAITL